MDTFETSSRWGTALTSRKGSWITLGVVLAVMTVLFGIFGSAKAPDQNLSAPVDSESAQVEELLQKFPGAEESSLLVVATAEDGEKLTPENISQLKELLPVLDEWSEAKDKASGPMISQDQEAGMLVAPMVVAGSNPANAELIKDLRADLADHTPEGLNLYVTGGPAFGADVAASFDGADFTLLLVTIIIVAVLLIVTYRSPVLWLIPLVVVALADGLAGRLTAAAGEAWDLQYDAGIISVLVFGAGTNYALLLISRYREELVNFADHRKAMAVAWRGSISAILASNITVVLALAMLVFAVIPGNHGLGISSAIGLLVALAITMTLLPAALALVGRKVFWPFIPHFGQHQRQGRIWHKIARSVVGRPVVALVSGLVLLSVMAAGLFGTGVGLDQLDKFRVKSESATGLEVLSQHYPAGEAQPISVVHNSRSSKEVLAAIDGVDGIERAHPIATSEDEKLVHTMVVSSYEPSTPESLDQITELREAVHDVDGADAVVGGQVATDVDARNGNEHDFFLVAPLVLAVSFIVLTLLLRSAVAPILLMLTNLISTVATIGAGSFLSKMFFGLDNLDLQVPLLAFLFLVALGIDYTIFLTHRARHEAARHGTREGMIQAVTHTGSVITSAGIVLAAVFAALGVLPLVTLGQLGLIVGLGVVVDTLVVRTIIVPAIFSLLGEKVWWPSAPAKKRKTEHQLAV